MLLFNCLKRALATSLDYKGRTQKMNLFTAINDAMSIALEKDPKTVSI